MRWYWQLAVIGVVGGLGYGGYTHWDTVRNNIPEAVRAYIPGLGGATASATPAAPRPGGPGGPGGGQAPIVEVAPVGRGPVIEVAEAVGSTRAYESVVVTTKISGIVERVMFEEGQLVTAGQELMRLDGSERRADLEALLAAVQQSEAQRNETLQRLERARQLRQTGAGTEAQVVDLAATVRTAESAIVAAQARARSAEARLADMSIRAPFAGRMGIRQVSVGALVEPRNPIATLDDLSRIRLDFQVPEGLIARIATGVPIIARTIAFRDREFPGRVEVIDTRIDPVTRSVRLTALIDNADMALRPGMFMTVNLKVTTKPDALLVAEEAIVGEGPRQIAFVVRENRVERRVVELGQRQEGRIEVLAGLQAGETVVVRGVQRVRQGMQVSARPLGQGGPPQGGPGGGQGGQRPPGAQSAAPPAGGPAAPAQAQATPPAAGQPQTQTR
jgi:membrane fusion protein, multidrug efflux system